MKKILLSLGLFVCFLTGCNLSQGPSADAVSLRTEYFPALQGQAQREVGDALAGCGADQLHEISKFLRIERSAERLYKEIFAKGYPDAQRDADAWGCYILSPYRDLGSQLVDVELFYLSTGDSGEYDVFWVGNRFIDYPETGEGHTSTLNFLAVSAQDSGPILLQRSDDLPSHNDPGFGEAFQRESDRWNRFWRVVNGEEPLGEDDPLQIN